MPNKRNKPYENRTIVLPFKQRGYASLIADPKRFRAYIDKMIAKHPRLFPAAIEQGFLMKDSYHSEPMNLTIRRIEINNVAYTIRPSFVLPRLVGWTKDAQPAMLLRKYSVPFWVLAYIFGRSTMYWWRIEKSLGRYSIVETTVQHPDNLPPHLAADEKHSWLDGTKVFIATICGWGCILATSVTEKADETALTEGYGVFKREAQAVKPGYSPTTILTDAWAATRGALKTLFPKAVLILCWLHIYLSLRNRSKHKHSEAFSLVADKLWECYRAPTQSEFSQRLRRMSEWAEKNENLPQFMRDKLRKVHQQADAFRAAYSFPFAQRTSSMIDRLMQRMDKHLSSIQYFRGSLHSANLSIRAWALIHNFAPFNPYTRKQNDWSSPAEALNEFRYHECWLQNLLISTSLVGKYRPPQKAV